MKKIEMELVTLEVDLVRAALRLRAMDGSRPSAIAYKRIADRMEPIGLYEFSPLEAACISLSLFEYSELSNQIGLSELAQYSMELSDELLCKCKLTRPFGKQINDLTEWPSYKKVGVHDARGWKPPIFRRFGQFFKLRMVRS
ncbi:hypothetical protein D3C74_109680 [compost metagenome]